VGATGRVRVVEFGERKLGMRTPSLALRLCGTAAGTVNDSDKSEHACHRVLHVFLHRTSV
jgi:hypothetical protein